MKLGIYIAVILLLLGAANSVLPMEPETDIEDAADDDALDKILQSSVYDLGDDDNQEEPDAEYESDLESDDLDYPDEALEEDFNYEESHEVAASQNNIKSVIRHGDTVALQTFVSSYWLGCSRSKCGRVHCPKMLMSGGDWKRCWGEVFQIYRKKGPGCVRVGDRVGLYYPRERGKWFGCNRGKNCGKATCPGHPNAKHGFGKPCRWRNCWGEVFYIFARGKKNGAVINSDDNIALYYIREKLWVAVGDHRNPTTIKLPCLGKTPPIAPPLSCYDGCAYETFRIWKRAGRYEAPV